MFKDNDSNSQTLPRKKNSKIPNMINRLIDLLIPQSILCVRMSLTQASSHKREGVQHHEENKEDNLSCQACQFFKTLYSIIILLYINRSWIKSTQTSTQNNLEAKGLGFRINGENPTFFYVFCF